MSELVFEKIRKVYPGGVVAVEDFDLVIAGPSMTVLVGPSGCGKTTLLRLVAGLEKPSGGRIVLGGERIDDLPPRSRDIAMVFQNYALYPHMTVSQNLSFGLRVRRCPRDEIERRVSDVAASLEIDGLLGRKPAALSGGQRQRVALGRAIIRQPRVFLFDEPLSNLDARLRSEMRGTIKRLYERLRVTSIYVTHDQVEAMTIGECLVVMKDGRIHQIGTPDECYREPADTFVASFLGSPAMNFLDGEIGDGGGTIALPGAGPALTPTVRVGGEPMSDGRVVVGIRPESVDDRPPGEGQPCWKIDAHAVMVETLGHETLTHFETAAGRLVARSRTPFHTDGDGRSTLFVAASRAHLFDAVAGRRIVAAPRGRER